MTDATAPQTSAEAEFLLMARMVNLQDFIDGSVMNMASEHFDLVRPIMDNADGDDRDIIAEAGFMMMLCHHEPHVFGTVAKAFEGLCAERPDLWPLYEEAKRGGEQ